MLYTSIRWRAQGPNGGLSNDNLALVPTPKHLAVVQTHSQQPQYESRLTESPLTSLKVRIVAPSTVSTAFWDHWGNPHINLFNSGQFQSCDVCIPVAGSDGRSLRCPCNPLVGNVDLRLPSNSTDSSGHKTGARRGCGNGTSSSILVLEGLDNRASGTRLSSFMAPTSALNTLSATKVGRLSQKAGVSMTLCLETVKESVR